MRTGVISGQANRSQLVGPAIGSSECSPDYSPTRESMAVRPRRFRRAWGISLRCRIKARATPNRCSVAMWGGRHAMCQCLVMPCDPSRPSGAPAAVVGATPARGVSVRATARQCSRHRMPWARDGAVPTAVRATRQPGRQYSWRSCVAWQALLALRSVLRQTACR